MSEANFTEGEWEVKLKPNGKRCVQSDSGRQVCLFWNDSSVIANAYLMAQSKNMYHLLDRINKAYVLSANENDEIEHLLAKARGE